MTDPSHIDELLQHAQWVRRVARSLVTGEAQVDDVVQQTWLVALQQRPRDPARLRAWLGGIARNLARRQGRGERRRQRREQAQPAPAPQPSTDELVARAEQQAVLSRAVVALPEPYRSTLLLRYVEDLSAAQIARRQGLPAATVRTRQRRALDLLREQLDEDFGTARRDWCLGLVPLALSAPKLGALTTVGTLLTGASVMSAKSLVTVVSVVVLATAAWLIEPFEPGTATAPVGSSASAAPVVAAAPVSPAAPAAPGAKEALLADAGTPEALAAPALEPVADAAQESPADTLTGVVLGADGRPLPDAELRFAWNSNNPDRLRGERDDTPPARSDVDGRFVLPVSLEGMDATWLASTLLVVLHDQHVATLHGNPPLHAGANDVGVLRLAAGGAAEVRVQDEHGRPLGGATLELLDWRPIAAGSVHSGVPVRPEWLQQALRTVDRVTGEADGRLTLDGLPPGRVDLLLSRPDRAAVALTDIPIVAGETAALGLVALPVGEFLAGTVRDVDGAPVADAPVWIERLQTPREAILGEDPTRRAGLLVHTDASGRYAAGGLFAGAHRISSRVDGSAFAHLEPVLTGTRDADLVLRQPGELIVGVRDKASGALLAGAQLWQDLPDRYDELVRHIRDELRRARGDDLPAGLYRITGAGQEGTQIRARVEGYRPAELLTGPVPPGGTLSVDLLLEPSVAFRGVVVDDTGEPVPATMVQIAARTGALAGTATLGARSDDDGRFVIDAAVGDWSLWVYADHHLRTANQRMSIEGADDPLFVVQLTRQRSVEGVVRDLDEQPVAGASVAALLSQSPSPDADELWQGVPIALRSELDGQPRVTTADDQGRYQFLELPAGPLALMATTAPLDLAAYGDLSALPDPAPHGVVRLALGDSLGTTQDLPLLEGAVVSGRVRDGELPAGDVQVGVVALTTSEVRWRYAARTRTDAAGEYRLAGLLPGPAVLVVRADDGFVQLIPVELVDGELHIVDVTLEGETLRGLVVDSRSGEPIAGATVTCHTQRPDGHSWPAFQGLDDDTLGRLRNEVLGFYWVERTSAADGSFQARHLRPGVHWLGARASGYLTASLPSRNVDAEPLAIRFPMEQGAILEGLLLAEGQPEADEHIVQLVSLDDGRIVTRAWPDLGAWQMDPLEPGAYELRVVTDDEAAVIRDRRTLQLDPGDHERIEITLR